MDKEPTPDPKFEALKNWLLDPKNFRSKIQTEAPNPQPFQIPQEGWTVWILDRDSLAATVKIFDNKSLDIASTKAVQLTRKFNHTQSFGVFNHFGHMVAYSKAKE
jgi:hypothetical protein